MTVKFEDLLRSANETHAQNSADTKGMATAIADALKQSSSAKALPGVHPSDVVFDDENDDPFGGNVNNRRVAERIASQPHRKYFNLSRPIHSGDPDIARRDIARSKKINPDPTLPDMSEEELLAGRKPTRIPSPGSPAAVKAAAEPAPTAAVNAPPTWKP